MSNPILVVGGTGKVGRELVRLLCALNVDVKLLVRDLVKARNLFGHKVSLVKGDLRVPNSLALAVQDVNKVFLASSSDPQQVDLQGNLVYEAKRAGVSHIVKLSALGVAPDSPIPVARWHWLTEQQIRGCGFKYTFLRPSYFTQNFLSYLPSILAERKVAAPMANGRISIVDVRDIAAVAVKVLTEPGHGGKSYNITGPAALTFYDVACILSDAIGHTITYQDISLEQARKGMLDAKMPEWQVNNYMALFRVFRNNGGAHVTSVINKVTEREPSGFPRFALDYAKLFKSEVEEPYKRHFDWAGLNHRVKNPSESSGTV